jgi:hypothetical protein
MIITTRVQERGTDPPIANLVMTCVEPKCDGFCVKAYYRFTHELIAMHLPAAVALLRKATSRSTDPYLLRTGLRIEKELTAVAG